MNSRENIIKEFCCSEYYLNYSNGYYDKSNYLQLLLPYADSYLNSECNHLVIGHAGVDGIEFCYRKNLSDIWVYYPIEMNYDKVANNIESLINNWLNGTIKV